MPEQQTIQEAVKQIPKSFILDASILDMQEIFAAMKEDIKNNRIEFLFPDGLNQVDLIEECRALGKLDDFDTMYDLTMQMLEGKPLVVSLKNYDGTKSVICNIQVTDRYMNLRGEEVIDQNPIIVNLLTEFIGMHISKKIPLPGKSLSQPQAAKKTSDKKKQKIANIS
jgi:hypothetical protein